MPSRRMMMAYIMSNQSRLPAEFQEVEYLESTGTQYIDSGVATNSYDKIYFDFLISSYVDTTTKYDIFIGARTGSTYNVLRNSQNHIYFNPNTTMIETLTSTLNYRYKALMEYGLQYQKITINDLVFTSQSTRADISINTWLFVTNRDGNVYRPSAIKLFACKIYNNDTIVRDFVPCYRKADNVAGLYDLVNGVFYTNAGTGTFIVGGNV